MKPADLVLRLFALGLLGWTIFFAVRSATAPYPLDAFEDYELHRCERILHSRPLYERPGKELAPTPYPPGFYIAAAAASWAAGGVSYVPGRLVSGATFLIWAVGAYWLARRRSALNALAVSALVAVGFRGAASHYVVARPDMLMAGLLGAAAILAARGGRGSTVSGGVAAACAMFTKQTALPVTVLLVFLVPPGGRRWFVGACAVAFLLLGAALLGLSEGSSAWFWCLRWPLSHGFTLTRALHGIAEHRAAFAALVVAPLLLLPGRGPATRAGLVALGAVLFTAINMGKWGAEANHLLLPVVVQTTLLACHDVSASLRTWACCALLVAVTFTVLPDASQLDWQRKRQVELESWRQAVQQSSGAVAHYAVLSAHADIPYAGFSDLALKLPGYAPEPGALARVLAGGPEWLVLSAPPDEWRAGELAELFRHYYEPAGALAFYNRSGVLPSKVFRRISRQNAPEQGHVR